MNKVKRVVRTYVSSLLLLLLMANAQVGKAQEFLCSVSVNSSRIQGDKQIFQEMQRTISEYINNYQWTGDQFEFFEKVRWSLRIIVNDRPTADYFVCRANIQAFRPVYNSTEETLVLNINDNNFDFNYVAMQQMQHLDNTYTNNLTALLDFYAYLVLGFDYDSFSPDGGAPYFRKAQEMINLASNSNEKGWRAAGDTQNRYWIMENLTNSRYKGFHEVLYKYHRSGMDQMESDVAQGREAILETLRTMNDLRRQNALAPVIRIFLDAKEAELIQIYRGALPNQQQTFVGLMEELDPANANKYSQIQK